MLKQIADRGDCEHFGEINALQELAMGRDRLAIVRREGGRQPICDTEGGVGAVFNGEIYNFREQHSNFSFIS